MEWALEAMEWAFAGAKALRKLMFEPPWSRQKEAVDCFFLFSLCISFRSTLHLRFWPKSVSIPPANQWKSQQLLGLKKTNFVTPIEHQEEMRGGGS
jgi:hypothetical protein